MTNVPIVDTYITMQLQIILFQQNSFDELDCVSTYIVDIVYAAQNLHNPPVTVSTLQAYDTPIVYRDQQLQDFLNREQHCHNFINQDLSFLQPSTVYHTTDTENNLSIASDTSDESVLTIIENDQSHEVDSTPTFMSTTALLEELEHLTMTIL